MIEYSVIHHTPGRIRLRVPVLKGVSLDSLKRMAGNPLPAGIEGVRPNPFSGSVVITYNPQQIDIEQYIQSLASTSSIEELMEEALS